MTSLPATAKKESEKEMSPSEARFFKAGDAKNTWQRYCGFLDLSLEEFTQIQGHLLREQIDLVADTVVGKELLQGRRPATVEEFRRTVPLTSYKDYAPYLNDKRDECFAKTEHVWIQTSAQGGVFKRVPWASRFQKVQVRNIIAALILSSSPAKGEVTVTPGLKILQLLPGKPYASPYVASGLAEQLPVRFLPPLDGSGEMTFRKRIDAGLRMALTEDVDFVISITSSLLRAGNIAEDMFGRRRLPVGLTKLHPKVLSRVLLKWIGGRKRLSPKDLWSLKGVIGWGADSDVFKARIEEQWGRPFFQLYASSEAGIAAMQESVTGAMAFLHDSVFFEFLPEDKLDDASGNSTVLISQVEDGKLYEPVLTSFYGMPFLRYRQGDLVRIKRDGDTAVPRMVFHGRADDVIDLFGIARLNTKTVSKALEVSGKEHGEWCLRKEYVGDSVVLRLYIELGEGTTATEMERRFHVGLKAADQHYREAVYTMACNPVRVTALPRGSFQNAASQTGKSSNIRHMNPPESLVQELRKLSGQSP